MFHLRYILNKAVGFDNNRAVISICRNRTLPQPSSISAAVASEVRFLSTHRKNENVALQSVIRQGLESLQSATSEIQSKAKRRLFITDEDTGPSIEQIQESIRLQHLVEDAVEAYTLKRGSMFCIMDEPISIIDVEVSEDLRHARVYWSLPFSFLIKDGIPAELRKKVMDKMQKILETRGGPIQGMVHQKLRHYYRPPTIRWVQAETEMLRKVMKDLMRS